MSSQDERIIGNGLVAVEGGKVKVIDPAPGGLPAMIEPSTGVRIKINGVYIEQRTPVRASDVVEIETLTLREPFQFKVAITAKGLTAEAMFLPGKEITYTVLDTQPARSITVNTARSEVKLMEADFDQLRALLKEQGVVYGIEEETFPSLLKEPEVWQTVARGRPPVEGKNGYVEFLFKEEELEKITYSEDENRVDFRKRYEIQQVEENGIIALVHPPVEGQPGCKVTGEEVLPEAVQAAVVRCEEGAMLNEEGTHVIATRKGRPVYKKGREHTFAVENLYVHKDNVDMKSGNLQFQGHLKINGGIAEGMTAQADGDIVVASNAAGAQVLAGGNITFMRNCINCQVRAGWRFLQVKEIYNLINGLYENVDGALKAGRQVMEILKERGQNVGSRFPVLMQTLIQNKYPDIPRILEKLQPRIKSADPVLPEAVTQAVELCVKYFSSYGMSGGLCVEEYENALHYLQKAVSYFHGMTEEKANITAYYVQNSNLACTGDIIVNGPGSYNSNFDCGGKVKVDRLFRGGSIVAGDDVYIGEAGSPGSSNIQGLIQVPLKNSVRFGKVYENTRVKIGDRIYRFESTLTSIKVFFDEGEDRVKVGGWK